MIKGPDYSAHADFVAPARASPALWRLLLGVVVAVVGYIAFNQMFFQSLYGFMQDHALYLELVRGSTPRAMYLLLYTFGFMILSVGIVVRVLHRRPVRSLLGPVRLALAQFGAVGVMLIAISLVLLILPPWDMGGAFVPNMRLGMWLMLLPVSLLAVLVQVSAEEVFFRGYVQQQLAARFRSPWIWMVLPSTLFALGHYLPETAGDNAWTIALWAGFFGILMADITARAGSLGPAIALHLWNNVAAILIVALPDELSGLALYHAPFALADDEAIKAWLPVDFALMIVGWLAARLAIRR